VAWFVLNRLYLCFKIDFLENTTSNIFYLGICLINWGDGIMMPETYVLAGIDVIPSIMEFKGIYGITSILEKYVLPYNKPVMSK